MAAAAGTQNVHKSPLFTKPNNGRNADREAELPGGRCNFTNLNISGGATIRCGCLRYWDKAQSTQNGVGDAASSAGWCMCEHHACYHEAQNDINSQIRPQTSARVSSFQNGGPRLSQASLGYERVQAEHRPLRHTARLSQDPIMTSQTHVNTPLMSYGRAVSLPDTQRWLTHSNSAQQSYNLPPIPSECLMPSDISLGDASGDSQAFLDFYNAHTAAQDDSNLSSKPKLLVGNVHPLITNVGNRQAEDDLYLESATHENTPQSPSAGTPNALEYHVGQLQLEFFKLKSSCFPGDQVGPSVGATSNPASAGEIHVQTSGTGEIASSMQRIMPRLENILKHVSSLPSLSTITQNHGQRIDLLENASYSNIAVDELKDVTENLDDHIREIESKVEDLARSLAVMNDAGSVVSLTRGPRFLYDRSITSDTSSANMNLNIDHSDITMRLDALESQLSGYQTALPTYHHPWTLEVIYLPFGLQLKGLWSTLDNFQSQRSRQNSAIGGDWTQRPAVGPESQYKSETPHYIGNDLEREAWEDIPGFKDGQNQWLVARACGIGSKVEQRLRSRGLIKTVHIYGPDARDVQAAMMTSFGDVWKAMEQFTIEDRTSQYPAASHTTRNFHGLRAPWIPLRKLHKDSKLRLLDPSEMISPALWTTTFLSSSVVMRATGIRRLYVTHRDAYLQHKMGEFDWTWQNVRELPRVYTDLQSSVEVCEADAMERCWEYDARIDPPANLNSSFASEHTSLSIRSFAQQSMSSSSESEDSEGIPSHWLIPTTTSLTNKSAALRPVHGRTTSMPLPAPTESSMFVTKRRIVSQEDLDNTFEGRYASAHAQSSPLRLSPLLHKRRRYSRSPSRPMDTPRWSNGPPSPYISPEEQALLDAEDRATTPFAYATPHSNFTPHNDYVRGRGSSGLGAYDDDDSGSTTDEIEFYDDDEDFADDDDDDEDDESALGANDSGTLTIPHCLGQQGEDDIWEGVDPDEHDNAEDNAQSDAASEASSGPSEYPSTHPVSLYIDNNGSSTSIKHPISEPVPRLDDNKHNLLGHVSTDLEMEEGITTAYPCGR